MEMRLLRPSAEGLAKTRKSVNRVSTLEVGFLNLDSRIRVDYLRLTSSVTRHRLWAPTSQRGVHYEVSQVPEDGNGAVHALDMTEVARNALWLESRVRS